MEQDDRAGPHALKHVLDDPFRRRRDVAVRIGLDAPRHRRASRRGEVPRQSDELVAEGGPEPDRAALAGGPNERVGTLDLRPDARGGD